MLSHENLYVFLFALPIYQLLFYTVQLISFKKKNPSRKYLGLLLLNMTLVLILNAVHHLGYTQLMTSLYLIFTPLLLCLLPVFYLYLCALTTENHQVSGSSRFILFIFPILGFLLNVFTFGMLPLNERILIITGDDTPGVMVTGMFDVARWIYHWAIPVLIALQGIAAFFKTRLLFKFEKEAVRLDPGRFAYVQPVWIVAISISLILFILAVVLTFLISGGNQMAIALASNIVLLTGGGIAGYYGMKQDALLEQVASLERAQQFSIPDQDTFVPRSEPQEYAEQPRSMTLISKEEANRIVNRLKKLMRENKPYLDARYSLNDLCSQLDISRRIMTYVLNEVMGKNFYGFVNEYRMKDAIQIMEDSGKKYTIEAISEMVGFNSKSSFYACFKKYTGFSPKEYFDSK